VEAAPAPGGGARCKAQTDHTGAAQLQCLAAVQIPSHPVRLPFITQTIAFLILLEATGLLRQSAGRTMLGDVLASPPYLANDGDPL